MAALGGKNCPQEPRGAWFVGAVIMAHASCSHAELLSSGQGTPWKPETLEGEDMQEKSWDSTLGAPRLAKAPSALSEAPTEQLLTEECD